MLARALERFSPVKSLYSRFKGPVPESFVFGAHYPERENLYGCYSQAVTKSAGVMARSGIRAQQFPIIKSIVLSELLIFQLNEELDTVLRGENKPIPMPEIDAVIRTYEARYEERGSGGIEGSRYV